MALDLDVVGAFCVSGKMRLGLDRGGHWQDHEETRNTALRNYPARNSTNPHTSRQVMVILCVSGPREDGSESEGQSVTE